MTEKEKIMKIFAPSYYKDFKCIADRCRHSCCVGWEIDVDPASLKKYEELGEIGKEIISKIDLSEDIPHFRLTDSERCPFLADSGLCKIISSLGEGYLCDICREHPRFYNYLPDRCEVGLGAACEEAARLILECENYRDTIEVGEKDGEETDGYSPIADRERVREILADRSIPFSRRISTVAEKFCLDASVICREAVTELEYLDEKNADRFSVVSFDAESPAPELSERALAYFVYRHVGSASDREEFRLSLGAALFLERLFTSVIASEGAVDIPSAVPVLRLISEEIEYNEDNIEFIKSEFI